MESHSRRIEEGKTNSQQFFSLVFCHSWLQSDIFCTLVVYNISMHDHNEIHGFLHGLQPLSTCNLDLNTVMFG